MSEPIVLGYDPNHFDAYENIETIRERLKSISPLNDDVFELVHLNREAARLLSDSESNEHESTLTELIHTCGQEIKQAATGDHNQERIDNFQRGIDHTLRHLVGKN